MSVGIGSVVGCAGSPSSGAGKNAPSYAEEAQARAAQVRLTELNQALAMASNGPGGDLSAHDYRLGPGDVIKIEAPQVPEIQGLRVRITGPGTVNLPLVGELRLSGLTVGGAEQLLSERLSRYVHQPQVALFVQEYASQEVTVTGAVARPGVFPITRPRTLIEVLSMAGGLAGNAGSTVGVRTVGPDPQTGEMAAQNLILDLRDLVANPNANALVLRGGDSLYVPEAGTIFVDGAVANPGSFALRSDMTVLKAIAEAGGTNWEAIDSNVRVIRHDGSGAPRELAVDLAAVRDRGVADLPLEDGDVVIVDSNTVKKGAVTMWNQTLRVLSLRVLYR
ncbi:polysaccharide biosynthesis/export family protein [Thiocapsa rosea]|nr:polysaccharide biosynthesis/export family protein [Thiocapsa rosea]